MDIIIRKATASDAENVAKITREAWTPIYEGFRTQLGDDIYESVYKNPLDEKEEVVKSFVLDGSVFVAEIDGVLCGFASFGISGKIGLLTYNAVSENFRGKGIAAKLHNRVFEELKNLGAEIVHVSTGLDDAHASARRAYEKDGFEVSLPKITYYKKLK